MKSARTNTVIGALPPLHLPAVPEHVDDEDTQLDMTQPRLAPADDTIVVDVEVNAAGQIVITGAERAP